MLENLWIVIKNGVELIRITDILDVFIIAWLIYTIMKLLRGSMAGRVLNGVLLLLLFTQIANWLKLNAMYFILSSTIQIGIIALLILFQPELRRVLDTFGGGGIRVFAEPGRSDTEALRAVSQICQACEAMSASRTGALIVLERNIKLADIINTGVRINADISEDLIKNIFFNKAPLHDGAMIISSGRIAACGCMLPLSENKNLNSDLGMRHRSGIGMTENSDALVIIVSEETGQISIAVSGTLKRNITSGTLRTQLQSRLDESENKKRRWYQRIFAHRGQKGGEQS